MKKKLIISVSIILAVFIIGTVAGIVFLSMAHIGISTGTCLITDNGSVFLIDGNSPVRLSNYTENDDMFSSFETGDKILAVHDGIAESYPASTGAVFCIKLGKGSKDDIPAEVISSLEELGWLSGENSLTVSENISFDEKYIRTGLPIGIGGETLDFPLLTVISSEDELKAYSENKEKYGLNDEFLSLSKKYDEKFFSDSVLFLCFLEEGSGSNSHEVKKVLRTDGKYTDVYIDTVRPQVGTCDMAYHHIFIAVKKSDIENTDARLFIDGTDRSKKYENVSASKNFANISLLLPEGWKYEISEEESSDKFSVTIYHTDAPESNICIEFLTAFGVCGTGLRTEPVEINGYKAHKGIYDGNPTFDYICFEDTPGQYVIYNNANTLWWNEYGDTAWEILETLEIAEGIIFREEAVDIASKKAEGEYKRKFSEFDYEKGVWTVTFEKNETEQTVTVDATGNVIS